MSLTPPVFTSSATFTVDENLTAVGTIAATDTEGDTLVYSLFGGADKSKFAINSATGALTFIGAPDFETPKDSGGNNVYDLVVRVFDGTNNVNQVITVTVNDILGVTINGTEGDDVFAAGSPVNGLEPTVEGDTLLGLGGNDSLDGGLGADIMEGGDGNDTYFVDNIGDVVTELFGFGNDIVYSSVNFAMNADDGLNELYLTGTGNINGTGNDMGNIIEGNSGNNIIDGGLGGDLMTGHAGNDTYVVDDLTDTVVEAEAEGTSDKVLASADGYQLTDNVENLTLTGAALSGAGNALNNSILGNELDNTLNGNDGEDTLNGGLGADAMTGGNGDDSYVVDNAGDTTIETDLVGIDSVSSSLTWILSANVENLTLTGTTAIDGQGNAGKNTLTGNTAVNTLRGMNGADILNGGANADIMYGGGGTDTYYVDNVGDQTIELNIAGVDLVYSKIDWTLSDYVENATLQGTANNDLTGNTGNNFLTGNSGANVLTGGDGDDSLNGMTGADTMIGGIGNDTYYVNQNMDVVTELADQGIDTVRSNVTFDLGLTLEHLVLTGTSDIDGFGNEFNNNITGNYGNNVINGYGGDDVIDGMENADTMTGGDGNDTYYIQNVGDQTIELFDEGIDTVNSRLTNYTLVENIENLVLGGTYNINGTGNELNNTLTGNKGINTLKGEFGNDHIDGGAGNDKVYGGLGADDLWGGAGFDKFVLTDVSESGLNDATNDWIYDFAQGDKIELSLIDADTTVLLDQAFKLNTDATFSAGEINVTADGADVMLTFNIDADVDAEMSIRVKNMTVAEITAIDFVL